MKLPYAMRALRYPNFRLFFMGQGISLIGTWMQQIALSWLVFQLTDSSLQLSFVLFFGQLPALFLSPIAGVLVEKMNRHRLLIWTQSLALVQSLALTVLTLGGWIEIWMIWPLALMLGIINAFDITTRQAFLPEMVPAREDMVNAIGLNSSLVNSARLLGPALAATVLAASSPGVCFAINTVSYLAVLASLRHMQLNPWLRPTVKTALFASLSEGFRYVTGFVPIRVILVALAIASMAGGILSGAAAAIQRAGAAG